MGKRSVGDYQFPARPGSVGVSWRALYIEISELTKISPLVNDRGEFWGDSILGARYDGDDGVFLGYGAAMVFDPSLPHVGEVVFFPAVERKELTRYIPWIYAVLRDSIIEVGYRRQKFSRLQAHFDNTPTLRSFGERLGFEVEGLLRHFGPNGEDRLLMSMLPWRHKPRGMYNLSLSIG